MARTHATRRNSIGLAVVAACLLAASPKALKGWGEANDPGSDCRFEQANDKLTVRIPGTSHNLVAGEPLGAPTVLSPLRGDFITLVKVPGNVHPGPKPSVAGGLPYNGAGLLIWVDRDNFIRLERAGLMREDAFITYANLEHFSGGRRVFSQGARLQDLATYLRLERRGASVYAATSPDGVNWSSFPPLAIALPDELKIGVAAVNTSDKPFTAEFSGFDVFARREVQGK